MFASLYNSGVREVAIDVHSNARLVPGDLELESQAVLISKDFARLILNRSRRIQLIMQPDFLKLRLRLKAPIHFHAPSLVQTVGVCRTPTGRLRRAFVFDPVLKAST